jgi:hypothetical protein
VLNLANNASGLHTTGGCTECLAVDRGYRDAQPPTTLPTPANFVGWPGSGTNVPGNLQNVAYMCARMVVKRWWC